MRQSTVTEQDRREFGRRASAAIERFRLGVYISGAAVGVMDDFGNLQLPNSDAIQVYEERNCFAYPYFRSTRPAKFEGMEEIDGEQFAVYSGVNLG